jgi:hypothetical protein
MVRGYFDVVSSRAVKTAAMRNAKSAGRSFSIETVSYWRQLYILDVKLDLLIFALNYFFFLKRC